MQPLCSSISDWYSIPSTEDDVEASYEITFEDRGRSHRLLTRTDWLSDCCATTTVDSFLSFLLSVFSLDKENLWWMLHMFRCSRHG